MGDVRLTVLDVADRDELWVRHANKLQRAGVFLSEEEALDAMRALWVSGPQDFRSVPGNGRYLDLSAADRRLLVAWTWPNPWGVPAPAEDVFGRVRAAAQGHGPQPSLVWAEEVRLRVAEVAKRLNKWEVREREYLLSAAASLLDDDVAPSRLFHLMHGTDPLVVEFLLGLSHQAALLFDERFTPRGAWAADGVALRAALRQRDALFDPSGHRRAPSHWYQAGPTVPLPDWSAEGGPDTAQEEKLTPQAGTRLAPIRYADPRTFHALLPPPPKKGRKYRHLFEFLDRITDSEVLTLQKLGAQVPSERQPGSRGKHVEGRRLPEFATRPAFWVNPPAENQAALTKSPWVQSWLAAGLTAHPVVEGAKRKVVAVRFDPRPGRETWWPHRRALRAGTFQPWEQIGPADGLPE